MRNPAVSAVDDAERKQRERDQKFVQSLMDTEYGLSLTDAWAELWMLMAREAKDQLRAKAPDVELLHNLVTRIGYTAYMCGRTVPTKKPKMERHHPDVFVRYHELRCDELHEHSYALKLICQEFKISKDILSRVRGGRTPEEMLQWGAALRELLRDP